MLFSFPAALGYSSAGINAPFPIEVSVVGRDTVSRFRQRSKPSLPTVVLIYAVRLNPGATELSERDWYDYREDKNVCGYCMCILGKCKVTELMSQMAQLVAEAQENNETIAELTNKVEQLEAEIEDIRDIVSAGQCGENAYYALYSNGKVLVKGTGAMYDYDLESNRSPFYRNDAVSSLVVSEGRSLVLFSSLGSEGRDGFSAGVTGVISRETLRMDSPTSRRMAIATYLGSDSS